MEIPASLGDVPLSGSLSQVVARNLSLQSGVCVCVCVCVCVRAIP